MGDLDLLFKVKSWCECRNLVSAISRVVFDGFPPKSYQTCILGISRTSSTMGDVDLLFKVKSWCECWYIIRAITWQVSDGFSSKSYQTCILGISRTSSTMGDLHLLFKVKPWCECWKIISDMRIANISDEFHHDLDQFLKIATQDDCKLMESQAGGIVRVLQLYCSRISVISMIRLGNQKTNKCATQRLHHCGCQRGNHPG